MKMGMFDSVYAPCPHCGKKVEFQSKADICPMCNVYTIEDAPTHILIDVLNLPTYCQSCGGWMVLIDPRYPPENPEPPRPTPEIVKTRTPADPVKHTQGFQWWPDHERFTYADLDPPRAQQSGAPSA
jgi:hypothetical protein